MYRYSGRFLNLERELTNTVKGEILVHTIVSRFRRVDKDRQYYSVVIICLKVGVPCDASVPPKAATIYIFYKQPLLKPVDTPNW